MRRLRVLLRRHAKGFTLISVIIAMVLLSVGVLALAGANATALRVFNTEGVRTSALQIARSHLESLRGRDPSTLVNEALTNVNELGAPTVDGRFGRIVTVSQLDSALIRVQVEVRPQIGRPVVLETQVFRPTW
ncbi:MAG: prepilin-type N-terminal cleavage/methylation domain-containing protein [Gemmatimonadaceae bacterium]|nr:prepilin-type N-terminal cleavage/methylation domain-containing protein [Gemmatimonadaceae bacterium]